MAFGAGLALLVLAGLGAARPDAGTAAGTAAVYQEGNMSITRTDYRGWHGCYRMSNGTAEVVIVPQIARIMQYGPAGGDGLLFVNAPLTPEVAGPGEPKFYPNYGGHKLWVAPQKVWSWPPHPELDRGPCRVEVLPDGALRMTGTPSAQAGVRFDRVLRLDREGTRLQIEQTMTNVSAAPVTWAIWDVTQVAADGTAVVPLGPDAKARFGDGEPAAAEWKLVQDAYLVGAPDKAQKLFAPGAPGWIAYRKGERLLLKSFQVPAAAPPQPETPREAWVGTDGFMELEFVGPQVTLAPGKSTTLTQEWRFVTLGPDAGTDEGLVRAARKAAAAAGL
jgi:hypothetical protein